MLRIKRGGSSNAIDFADAESELVGEVATPEDVFQRDWVRGVFAVAIERVRDSISSLQFAIFDAYDLSDDRKISYRDLAQRFAIPETTVTNHLYAARRKFREVVLETLREATASEEEFRAEARALLGVAE